jgi:hypothetical protein
MPPTAVLNGNANSTKVAVRPARPMPRSYVQDGRDEGGEQREEKNLARR